MKGVAYFLEKVTVNSTPGRALKLRQTYRIIL